MDINKILKDHLLWLDAKGGKRANLAGADLSGANLSEANLSGASLYMTDLCEANLYMTDLRGADRAKAL